MTTTKTFRAPAAGTRCAWVDPRPQVPLAERPVQASSTRWATSPLQTAHGQAVAVRLEGQDLRVGLRLPTLVSQEVV